MIYYSTNKFRITRIPTYKKQRHPKRLAIFIILITLFIIEQCGILTVSANINKSNTLTRKEYIYIRQSASIDDSWIGTPVSTVMVTTSKNSKIKTKTQHTNSHA